MVRLIFNGSAQSLSPPFAADTMEYAAAVPNRVATATVTPIAADSGAGISVKIGEAVAAAVDSGTASAAGNLEADEGFVFFIVVTSANGNVTNTYTVTVNRTSLHFAAQQRSWFSWRASRCRRYC